MSDAGDAFSIRLLGALAEVPAAQWDALHDGANPFLAHAFLHGLEATGCVRADWGWTPHHLTVWRGVAFTWQTEQMRGTGRSRAKNC